MTEDVQNIAKLTLNGATYDLPVMSPTAGPDVVDIRKLYAQANVFTYDPGFTSTASCDSTITSVSYTHLRAHETVLELVCRLLLEKKNTN